jgi:hypothetical protein
MRLLFRTCLAAAATAIALPAAAQNLPAFDGTYVGVSTTMTNTERYCTQPPRPAPPPLTIANGTARLPWGPNGSEPLVGTIGANGYLTLRSQVNQNRLDGQIDTQGNVKGGMTFGGAARVPCVWNMVWLRKR